jgi:hypothetical protein
MSFPTSCKFLVVCSVVLCAAVAMAQAPSTIFQLNGDPANDNLTCTYGTPCDYWNLINLTGSSGTARGHSDVNSFILGSSSTNAFTGGGSKDAQPISKWAYSSTNTPPKDGLNAGYAAGYNLSDFDVIFGADRFEGSGDANIGIWFFQNTVATNGTGGFSGSHANGGGISQIAVYTWDQPGLPNAITSNDGQVGCTKASNNNPQVKDCASANLLVLVAQTTTNTCTSTSIACAIANTKTVSATWASYNTPSDTITSPFFFEGGLDVTAAFAAVGGTAPCFSSFLEETRSSQSITAVLKDFLLGGFPVCSLSITKACGTATVNSDGTLITYPVTGTVTNTGIGTLTNVTVSDTVVGGATNTIAVTPSTLNPGQVGTWSDSSTSTATSQSDSAYATATASGTTIQSTNTASATCSLAVSTTLTVGKSCSTTLQTGTNGTPVSVLVSYGGSVCNTGPSQVTGISLKDYPDSIANGTGGTGSTVDSGITLGPGTTGNPTCKTYGPHTYTPTAIDETIDGGADSGRYFFDDLITIPTATAAVGTLNVVQTGDPRTNGTFGFGTARCPICAFGECAAQ